MREVYLMENGSRRGYYASSLACAHVLHDQVIHDAVDHGHRDKNTKSIAELDLIKLVFLEEYIVPAAELVHHEDLE